MNDVESYEKEMELLFLDIALWNGRFRIRRALYELSNEMMVFTSSNNHYISN